MADYVSGFVLWKIAILINTSLSTYVFIVLDNNKSDSLYYYSNEFVLHASLVWMDSVVVLKTTECGNSAMSNVHPTLYHKEETIH